MQIKKQIQTLNDNGPVIDNKLSWNAKGTSMVWYDIIPVEVENSIACALLCVRVKGPTRTFAF